MSARPPPGTGPVTPEDALACLAAGNARFATGQPEHPRTSRQRLLETAQNGQHPLATVLACSDSRVPPERVFDQGVGDIFVVRVAGNVAGGEAIASIEYGVARLRTPLLVVLGHTRCGAVTAAVHEIQVRGSVAALLDRIRPVVHKVRQAHPRLVGDDLLQQAVRANVWQGIADVLTQSGDVRGLVQGATLRIVGAIYDLQSGTIEWLGPHPDQHKLLATT